MNVDPRQYWNYQANNTPAFVPHFPEPTPVFVPNWTQQIVGGCGGGVCSVGDSSPYVGQLIVREESPFSLKNIAIGMAYGVAIIFLYQFGRKLL